MELLPGLRPAGPTLERANAPKHERDVTGSVGDTRGFDEQLDEISERRAATKKDDGPSRAEENASRSRPAANEDTRRLEANPAKDPEQKKQPVADEPALDRPRAAHAEAIARAGSPQPESAPAAEQTLPSAIAVEAIPDAVESSDDAAGAATPASSSAKPATLDPTAMAAASIAQAPATSAPAAVAAGPDAAGLEASAVESSPSKALTAKEPALLAPKLDTIASAPTGATPAVLDLPRDFERELARVRETTDPRTLHTARAHVANDSAAEILRQVRVGLSADLREANIQLAPEALGRVQIRLRVEHGALTADVRAESVQALRALELHAPELKAALAGHAAATRTLEFSFSLMNSHTGDAPNRGHARSHSPRASHHRFDLTPVQVEHALARRLSTSGVDTYA
ncbi:MAG: flagellar hook-length control protein FliK [Planctomycetota bacterium]